MDTWLLDDRPSCMRMLRDQTACAQTYPHVNPHVLVCIQIYTNIHISRIYIYTYVCMTMFVAPPLVKACWKIVLFTLPHTLQ